MKKLLINLLILVVAVCAFGACDGVENSITQAAYHGIAVKDATLYTTYSPCLMCAKMIINAGIKEVVYDKHYSIDKVSTALLEEAGVKIRAIDSGEDK